ncbi:MAG: 16S rRNA (cytidine(1402)-2'-O)-methyltransferase [Syntrophales bacterium]|jgi:16S rRNA (cytidine1402-2'-O)-methyltransferase
MKGKLYVISTPIGNLEDVTFRAIRILKEVDLITAEDTRRTAKLTRAYGIETVLTSLHDYNERRKSIAILGKIHSGMNVACVSDAGTPGISDPGYLLINSAIEEGIQIIPVPGPSAAIAALSVSGLPMDRFIFEGFLPSREAQRRKALSNLSDETRTMVFYESPKRIVSTLQDIAAVMGDRVVVVAREMTKIFEDIARGKISKVVASMAGRSVKGEITLIVSGWEKHKSGNICSNEDIRLRLEAILSESCVSQRDAIRQVADSLGVPRKQVYQVAVKNFHLDPHSPV